MINTTKSLVLVFFAAAWLSLVFILAASPGTYDETLRLPAGDHLVAEIGFLAALTAFLVLLSTGVIRGWRWVFWLVLIAFTAGILRVATAVLELAGLFKSGGPAWYVVYQGFIGMVQFAIGLVMIAGYRKDGIWGKP